ncbi:NfeD family protein [Modestobacter sp. SSW1-42]|uniref:NfeD family protein n=1 Tax=Modestobacter sp. SSW1-42 TaxID=596372 RepID=UPI0039863EE0
MAAWLLWLIAAGLFTAGEVASLDLVLLMFAGGALGGMSAALLTDSVPVQLAVFVIVSVGLLAVVRPVAKRHLVDRTPEQLDGVQTLVGRTAVVSERVDGTAGQVRMGHDEWSARTQLDGEVYEVGDEVRIVQIEGPIAYVGHP